MHRNTVGLIDDHKVTVLVDNPSAQCLSEHVGMDSLKLLCELHEFLHSPLDRVCGHLEGEKSNGECLVRKIFKKYEWESGERITVCALDSRLPRVK